MAVVIQQSRCTTDDLRALLFDPPSDLADLGQFAPAHLAVWPHLRDDDGACQSIPTI